MSVTIVFSHMQKTDMKPNNLRLPQTKSLPNNYCHSTSSLEVNLGTRERNMTHDY